MAPSLPAFVIDPRTRLGAVHLVVADAKRETDFYRDVLGFEVHDARTEDAALGPEAGETLVTFAERRTATRPRRATGLYHFAVVVPGKSDLARLLLSLIRAGAPIQGMVDHHTHLAIYLQDPEGNGVELAWDHPKEDWPPFDQVLRQGNGILDVPSLLKDIREDEISPRLPQGSRIGHVHLRVADLDASFDFYRSILGFEESMPAQGFGAGFVAAGGYHHHIAFNVWETRSAPPPPDGAMGLESFTIRLPDDDTLRSVRSRLHEAGIADDSARGDRVVRDPSGIGVRLESDAV